MSAYVVGDKHINALVTWAADKRVYYWDEAAGCSRHIAEYPAHRRSSCAMRTSVASTPATARDEPAGVIAFRRELLPLPARKAAAQIVQACRCYAYQTCETPDHRTTEAWIAMEAIEHAAGSGRCSMTIWPGKFAKAQPGGRPAH